MNKEIKTAKQNYFINPFDKFSGDTRKTWQTINELTCHKSNRTVINEVEYCQAKNRRTRWKLRRFSIHLSQKLVQILVKMLQRRPSAIPNFYPKLTICFPFVETTPAHVDSLLLKLSRSKATGPDNIPAKHLKECPDLICVSRFH